MTKEKCPIQFRNPCKNCLVKPACRKKCILLQNHIELFEALYVIVVVSISITVLAVIFATLYSYTSADTTLSIFALYITVAYTILIAFHIDTPGELRSIHIYERLFIIAIFPILIITSAIIIVTDPIMLKIKECMFKYHSPLEKRINKC